MRYYKKEPSAFDGMWNARRNLFVAHNGYHYAICWTPNFLSVHQIGERGGEPVASVRFFADDTPLLGEVFDGVGWRLHPLGLLLRDKT